ncbi:MAG: DUF192 domain-containing protein [Candidatus Omnitrophota bacterium]
MRIINLRNNVVLADKVKLANTFWSRLVGLLNRSSLEKGEALVLKPSYAIHTLFMRFSIDALFLDKNSNVVGIIHAIKPFRFSPAYFGGQLTIEFPEKTLQTTQTQLGDVIKIDE